MRLSLIPWMGDFERWSPGWGGVAGRGRAWRVRDLLACTSFSLLWVPQVGPGRPGGQEKPVESGGARLRGRVADDVVPQSFPSGFASGQWAG